MRFFGFRAWDQQAQKMILNIQITPIFHYYNSITRQTHNEVHHLFDEYFSDQRYVVE